MKYAVLLTAALLLTCCGGSSDNSAPPPVPPKKSRLIAFDTGGLDEGLTLPDFTNYWTLAEQKNGNSYPVKASTKDEHVMLLRLDAKGAFAEHREKWVAESLSTVARKMDDLGKKFWNSDKEASAAAVILFADAGAPYTELLKLCRSLVDLQVQNLWLVTRDTRDGAARLLPLKVDTDQLFREWYHLTPEEVKVTVRFQRYVFERKEQVAIWGSRLELVESDIKSWKNSFPQRVQSEYPGATRVQFSLPPETTIAGFADAVNGMSPVGFTDVEPYWPVLETPIDGREWRKARRELVDYKDEFGLTDGFDVPTLNEYWRAVAANERLPAPVRISADAPLLQLRVAGDGLLSTRARGEPDWTTHEDDLGFIQALQRNAGEIDFDTGASTLQLVMCMDRDATWETYLGVLEMMISAGVHRLFVVTNDVIGPTLRLLDLSLPLGGVPEDAKVASVELTREGIVADAAYTLKFTHVGETHEYTGARFASSLTIWAGERKSDPDVLVIKLPRDEPFETLFTVLNGAAWLGMKSIRIGG